MKETLTKIIVLLNTCGIALLLFLNECKNQPQQAISSHTDSLIVYTYDTSGHVSHNYYFNTSDNYLQAPAVIDTAEVIRAYFTKRTIKDLIDNDTLSIFVTDTLHKNNITYRALTWRLKMPLKVEKTYTITNTINTPAKGLYAGIFINYGYSDKSLTPGAELQYLFGKNAIAAGVDPFRKNLQFKYLRKLK